MKRLSWHQPRELEAAVENLYQVDVGEFPESITSVFGQSIPIIDNGKWANRLNFEHVGYKRLVIPWGENFSPHPLIEWAYRMWLIERVQYRIDVRPARLVGDELGGIKANLGSSISALEEAVEKWSCDRSTFARTRGKPQLQLGIRSFVSWCIEECLPGFSEHALVRILEIPLQKHGAEHLVSILDTELGPLTFEELRSIEAALEVNSDLIEQAAIYYLGRDWGLRPIQIALLRVEDVGHDELGPFIMVPSVKGVRRAPLRRDPSNMRKRSVAPDTYEALQRAIERAHLVSAHLRDQFEDWQLCSRDESESLPTPLFPAPRTKVRAQLIAGDQALIEYALHADAWYISRMARKLTSLLRIPRATDGVGASEEDYLQIGLLRLRRTKGTSMVLNGASPAEVADALDHATLGTIAHYFKFNLDLISHMDAIQSKSTDITQAALAWSGKFAVAPSKGQASKTRIGKLGLCGLGKPCPHHPTVSCYSCKLFEPYASADHEQAKKDILQFKALIDAQSTGPVINQLSAAVRGVDAVIQAAKEHKNVRIGQSSSAAN